MEVTTVVSCEWTVVPTRHESFHNATSSKGLTVKGQLATRTKKMRRCVVFGALTLDIPI